MQGEEVGYSAAEDAIVVAAAETIPVMAAGAAGSIAAAVAGLIHDEVVAWVAVNLGGRSRS